MKLKSAIALLIAVILIFCSFPIGTFAEGETIYYVSVSGSDSNTGLSENSPLKTISAVNNLSLSSGAKVLFKRGDIWRGETLYTQAGVYYGAYGEGEKPAFYGSYQNYAREEYWTLSDTQNVYKSTFTLNDDIGAIVFDNDSFVGARFIATSNLSDLYKNGMFLIKDESADKSIEVNRIYVYNNSGNPGAVYNQMEFIQKGTLIEGESINGVEANGITVEDICLKYGNYGYHINGTQKNVVLRRLDISFIGGRFISSSDRGGNAIEFYGNSQNVLVEDCKITQIYDTAFTCQMYGGLRAYFKDITFRNCDVSYCHWTTEFWFRPKNSYDMGTIENVKLTGNRFSYAGYGFGTEHRYVGNDTSKSTFMNTLVYENYTNVDITISDNIFNGTKHYYFYSELGKFTPKFSGNTYILTDDSMPGQVNGSLDTTMGDSVKKMAFEPDAAIKRAHSITNISAQTFENAAINGDFEEAFAEDSITPDNWYSENDAVFSATDKISGQKSLKVNGNNVTGDFDVFSATPYRLGFWYKGNADVSVKDEDGNILIDTNLSNSDWDYYYLYFTTPEDCKKAYITLSGNSLYDKIMMSYYPEKQILSYQNGDVVLDDIFYTVGEKVKLTVLPTKSYELEDSPILAVSDGTCIPSVYDEEAKTVEFTAPDGNLQIMCYFRKSGYIYGENLLLDSGFDKNSAETPWTVYWSTSLSSASYDAASFLNKTGDSCIQFANYSGGIGQSFNVCKGKSYELSFLWSPNASNGSTTQMRVTVGDNYGSYSGTLRFDYNKVITSQGRCYEKFRDTFTANQTGTVYLRLERASFTTPVYVDDISVCEITDINELKKHAVKTDKNIKNGTFKFSIEEAKQGETVVIEVLPDKNYALSEGTFTAFTENDILEISKLEDNSYCFVMPDSEVTVSAEFEFVNQGANGSVNILKDSACENAIGENWLQLWGSSAISATSDYASSINKVGDSCIMIPNWQGGVHQSFKVNEGETYTLSFLWAPCASGGSKTSMNVAIGDDYGDNPANCEFMLYEIIESYNYAYQKYSKTFTATKTGEVYVRFDRRNCGVNTVVLDDITLTTDYSVSFNSEEMLTDGDYIFDIKYGTAPETVIGAFDYDNCEFRFDGESNIKTGDTFTLYVSDTAVLSRNASVLGDCNSDGNVNILDFVALKKYCADSREFTEAEMLATRINGSCEGSAESLCELKKLLIG